MKWLAALIFLSCATSATAQSALERHAWQDRKTFQPYSRTAEAITGPIRLSGNAKFAATGSTMTIKFGKGKPVRLTSVGASYREWDIGSKQKLTAEVFRLASDPGKMVSGNTLCGDPKKEPARYIVFDDGESVGDTRLLGLAVFSSKGAPKDINSPGLCGTFNYVIK